MCCWAQFTDRGYCVAGVYTASVRPGTFTQSTATVFSVLHRKLLTLTYLYRQIHLSKQVHVIYACLEKHFCPARTSSQGQHKQSGLNPWSRMYQ